MKRRFLSKHDSQEIIQRLQDSLRLELGLSKSSQVEILEPREDTKFVVIDANFIFIEEGKDFIPFLGSAAVTRILPALTVDEGAIKYVLNGANIMRSGVRSFEEWGEAGKVLAVKEEKKGRTIAVGKGMVGSTEMSIMQKGPCVKNLHYVGDKFWNAFKQV